MRRMMVLLATTAMMVAMMAIPGVALAQSDVCVSIKGDVKHKSEGGTSTCSSDETSQAVAVDESHAVARNGSKATAINDSDALAFNNSNATAINESFACAINNGTATARNGELVSDCP
jgi:hypothetical protein